MNIHRILVLVKVTCSYLIDQLQLQKNFHGNEYDSLIESPGEHKSATYLYGGTRDVVPNDNAMRGTSHCLTRGVRLHEREKKIVPGINNNGEKIILEECRRKEFPLSIRSSCAFWLFIMFFNQSVITRREGSVLDVLSVWPLVPFPDME
ncbi:hypothetical protein NPIL_214391 [Nephila pilipes]|uniref:Uncharacterized protein n=1 Tax=Nephila pilipes TaxID=299642 RepID=A0A8X6Q309_NEPPI|nr:hypothetical protein NPIL_214391 [Nephila pilipes]